MPRFYSVSRHLALIRLAENSFELVFGMYAVDFYFRKVGRESEVDNVI